MTVIPSKAKKLARKLLRENRRGRSYRTIAREDYQGKVDQSTLSRIAREKGEWLPKDAKILKLLNVCKQPRHKRIQEMTAAELLWSLTNRTEMK